MNKQDLLNRIEKIANSKHGRRNMFIKLAHELKDYDWVSWHIDDVKSVDDSLTDDQCRDVLDRMTDDHDSTIGINWDVIQYHINEVLELTK